MKLLIRSDRRCDAWLKRLSAASEWNPRQDNAAICVIGCWDLCKCVRVIGLIPPFFFFFHKLSSLPINTMQLKPVFMIIFRIKRWMCGKVSKKTNFFFLFLSLCNLAAPVHFQVVPNEMNTHSHA